jgi:hypothetical protein
MKKRLLYFRMSPAVRNPYSYIRKFVGLRFGGGYDVRSDYLLVFLGGGGNIEGSVTSNFPGFGGLTKV